jgi:cytochrome oxidase Cu insertion factor (SCO1/SenC/PrrC family)
MKIAVAILFFFALFGLRAGEESSPANQAILPSLGLEVGQQAPAFALTDQFGHEQSNETLKGLKGTVLLFFHSAAARCKTTI